MRTGTWEDLPRLRRLLAAAYSADALMAWIFREPTHRADAVAAWLGLFLEPALQQGAVDVVHDDDGHVIAACAWRPPDPAPKTPAPQNPAPRDAGAPTVAGLLAALVGSEHAARVGAGLALLRPHAPQAPSAYVQFLAVDPGHQRRGLGSVALQPGLDRAAAAQIGVHLETTNPDAVPFYEARGFAVTAELDLPAGPHVWVLAMTDLEEGHRE
ncbi:Acetyltransferase (GNAT) family protein [Quadrisphaera granulorum]|uniref:Acetyltransferase (GNAT) family protein n=1 Tax=Quadrisphaera granulorum TaxID=317664 RepID=A0A316A793_9ACTN|nr:acetyltransferase (GNAT) family protein [Quadrisphaera granulorum]SZE99162.1 Acetyltransferase (GNAT) family protein [Quadrisphaera granulorum]